MCVNCKTTHHWHNRDTACSHRNKCFSSENETDSWGENTTHRVLSETAPNGNLTGTKDEEERKCATGYARSRISFRRVVLLSCLVLFCQFVRFFFFARKCPYLRGWTRGNGTDDAARTIHEKTRVIVVARAITTASHSQYRNQYRRPTEADRAAAVTLATAALFDTSPHLRVPSRVYPHPRGVSTRASA